MGTTAAGRLEESLSATVNFHWLLEDALCTKTAENCDEQGWAARCERRTDWPMTPWPDPASHLPHEFQPITARRHSYRSCSSLPSTHLLTSIPPFLFHLHVASQFAPYTPSLPSRASVRAPSASFISTSCSCDARRSRTQHNVIPHHRPLRSRVTHND